MTPRRHGVRPRPRPAPPSSIEDLLTWLGGVLLGTLLAVGLLIWSAGQLAGFLTHRRWPAVPATAGAGLAVRLPAHLTDPGASWPAPARDDIPGPFVYYPVLIVLLGAVAAIAAAVLTAVAGTRRGSGATGERERSPAWATRRQVRHLVVRGAEPGRLTLGRLGRRGPLVAAEPRRSVLVVAPTQAGKTSRFVVPAVLNWTGPLVVTSVKTDVLRLTHADRTRRGAVHVFDPTGTTGFPTAKWSPLLACPDYPAAELVAGWLVEAAGDGHAGENARFWESLAAKLLAPLLFAAAHGGGGMRQVSAWLDRRSTREVTDRLGSLGDVDALDAWAATCAREDRPRDSVYATAESIVKGFAAPAARAATEVTGADHTAGRVLDPHRLIEHGQTLYLVAPAHAQARLRPLFEALVQTVLRAAQDTHAASGRALDPPLLLMLDEAANIAPLRDLATHASTGAGQGIQICSVWQDMAQIQAIYGRNAATVVNNHTARVFLPGSADLTTLDQTSRMIGDFQRERVSVSVGPDGQRSITTAPTETRVAPVEDLRQLPTGTAVVLYGREPALRLTTTAWYEDRRLRRRVHPGSPANSNAATRHGLHRGPRHRAFPQKSARPPVTPAAAVHVGSDPPPAAPADARPQEPPMRDHHRWQPTVVPTGPSTLDRLAEVPRTDRYLDLTTGREYTIHHAIDGTPIPVPLDLTEAERDEIDRRSDRYQTELRRLADDSPPENSP